MLKTLPAANASNLTGKEFFPHLISGPFHHGLVVVFIAAALMSVIAAIASLVQSKPEAGEPALDAVEAAEAAGTSSLVGGGEADAESNGAAVFAEVARDVTGHNRVNGAKAEDATGTGNGHINGDSATDTDPVSSEAQR